MDFDDRYLMDDEDPEEGADEEGTEYPVDPCPRCGRNHVAVFFGERYSTIEIQAPIPGLHHDIFSQSSQRLGMRTCMDCGYIELYREEILHLDD